MSNQELLCDNPIVLQVCEETFEIFEARHTKGKVQNVRIKRSMDAGSAISLDAYTSPPRLLFTNLRVSLDATE